ncbi:MAG: ankyrin repeat domain-containing protein, partial [Wolbachia endosymbiont of Homalodisca vitripennis]|nr:ankyrin repeat domain-containing protein [Wolbachia endosymbiont of Homalodisca vitripennis]MCJ7476277.1 ankyrin repeat domain-containing protein [Wolbachia endosymbiont of Homalodisca vitripennis]
YFVERRANVNLRNEDGMSPLHIAAQYDYLGIVKYLAERGADLNLRNEDGLSSLHFAVQNGHLDIVKYLVERGASVNLQDKDGMSPLYYATENGHLDVTFYLTTQVATMNLKYKDSFAIYNQNIKIQSLASDLKVPSHKRQHKTSSESKKRRLENMSVISEEGSSNIQLLQGNISDISMQYEDLDHRMQGDICTEEKVNSQLENSDSQQMVNSRYLLCVQ